MIYIEIFSHSDIYNGTIKFEENDIKIVKIENAESLDKEDFNRIWEAVSEIETTSLQKDKWYTIALKRYTCDEYNEHYFETASLAISLVND